MTSLLTQIYSKDSFDRFGDDLCEYVLSYLSFNDSLRYECVSKQWKRLVFNKPKEMNVNLNKGYVDYQKFKIILMKCPFITSIDLKVLPKVKKGLIELIVKYCYYLTQITADFNGMTQIHINMFCHKFGSKLKKIKFYPNYIVFMSDSEPFNNISILSKETEVLFTELSDISFTYSFNDCNRIGIFCENYKNNLQSIEVNVEMNSTQNDLIVLFKSLTKLSKLKSLAITGYLVINDLFVDYLRELRYNCLELKEIKLNIRITILNGLGTELLESFNSITQLKRLEISLSRFFVTNDKTLNECKNLTHLSLDILTTDKFFNNINKKLPKLQHIKCPKSYISDHSLYSISRLSDLRTIDLTIYSTQCISDSIVLKFIKNCLKIKSILISTMDKIISLNDKQISELRQSCGQNITIYRITKQFYKNEKS